MCSSQCCTFNNVKEFKKMSILSKSSSFLRGALALTVVFGCGVAMNAQTTTDEANTTTPATLNAAVPMYSSSADQTVTPPANTNFAMNVKPFDFLSAMQYGSGARRGAPRYRGGNTNADGSNKWIFFGGVGLTSPIGNTHHYFTDSWGIQAGGGRQFSKKFALPVQFDYDNFGMTGQTIANQQALYAILVQQFNNANPGAGAVAPNPLDGNMHIWSFTVDPTETFSQTDSWGVYAVEGVGFYHKVSNFLTPETETFIDPIFGPESFTANEVIDHYTSNAVGFNAGLGVTYKFSRFSNERFYGEVRYVFIDNSKRTGITLANANSNPNNYLVANDFQANSNRTGYFPIKFGIRF
jgi:hypothetical protein